MAGILEGCRCPRLLSTLISRVNPFTSLVGTFFSAHRLCAESNEGNPLVAFTKDQYTDIEQLLAFAR